MADNRHFDIIITTALELTLSCLNKKYR